MSYVYAIGFIALPLIFALSGCTAIQRAAHLYSAEAPSPRTFQYRDDGSSIYYSFTVGGAEAADTMVFFYGGTGCPSWKSVMPGYVDGLSAHAHVFVLNKRFVDDLSTGLFACDPDFHLANNPARWTADYSEFIAAQVGSATLKPKNVVLVGVSEGAIPAAQVAALTPVVTHLAIIGSGAYSMRQSLVTLERKCAILFDVASSWEKIASDPDSIDKNWYGNPYRWWSDIMDIDPLSIFLELNIPILVGIGELDESVPVESVRFLEAKFDEKGKRNLTVKVYPGADHRLSADGVSYRNEFFAFEYQYDAAGHPARQLCAWAGYRD